MQEDMEFWFVEPTDRPVAGAKKKMLDFMVQKGLNANQKEILAQSGLDGWLRRQITQCTSTSAISGCHTNGISLDSATHVSKQSFETRSYATKGTA
jgi:hypothetical protein